MGLGDKNFYTSGELVPCERNKHTRTKLGRGRKDRTTAYRPPWHRANEGEFKLVCMPADMFGRVSALCQELRIAGEDAVELLDVISRAELVASMWPRFSERAVNDVQHAMAIMERDRAGVWVDAQHQRIPYALLTTDHLQNVANMLTRDHGYDLSLHFPNLYLEYKRRLLWTP